VLKRGKPILATGPVLATGKDQEHLLLSFLMISFVMN